MAELESLQLENPVAPGGFWALWYASLFSALPIMFVAVLIVWYGLDKKDYLSLAVALGLLSVLIGIYWHIHRHIDGYWQKKAFYRRAVLFVMALPPLSYPILAFIYGGS